MKESERIRAVRSPIIPAVAELIRKSPGTISLGQGVVNYGPPKKAIENITLFLSNPSNHRYQMVQGIPELLEPVEEKLRRENGVALDDERRVIITAGGNMAFLNAILAVADPGDEVIQLVPYYFNHEMAIAMADCVSVPVHTGPDYQPRIEAIREALTGRTRAVVTISPNNPTGAVYPRSLLRRINGLCVENGIYHIHDEAYEYFTYEGATHYSPAADPAAARHTISLYSMSKAYGFASWRIGWMVVPSHLFESVRKIHDTNLICPPVISQWAAAGALSAGRGYCDARIAELARVRSMVLEKLSRIGDIVEAPATKGAFYLLLRVDTDVPEMDIIERLIEEYRVAVIPGSTFGITSGRYLRVAFGALQPETVADGIDRLVEGLRAIA